MQKGVCTVSVSPAIDRTLYINDFSTDKVNRVENSFDTPGSKGVNVALNLARSGVPVSCTGFIGGSGAEFIKNALESNGVTCDFADVKYDVRTNLKVVDLNKKTYTDVNFPTGTPTDENISVLKTKLKKLARENGFIALSGNISSENLTLLYSELMTEAKSVTPDIKITLDCSGKALQLASSKKPYAIKPNLSEFNEAFSFDCKNVTDIKNAAFKVYESGVENILVSMDKNGAFALCSGKAYFVYNCDLPVYNTVGAGDAFLSGFLYAKYKNSDDIYALKCASSFAQSKVSHKAETVLTLADFSKHIPDIRVEELT